MTILVRCTCSKKLKVKDEARGKRIKCPSCNTVLRIPLPSRLPETRQAEPDDPPRDNRLAVAGRWIVKGGRDLVEYFNRPEVVATKTTVLPLAIPGPVSPAPAPAPAQVPPQPVMLVQPQQQVVVHVNNPSNPSNGLGTAGFVCSLLGLFTCFIVSPLGLFFSVLGLLKVPRGMAFAGTVLGGIGTAILFSGFSLAMITGDAAQKADSQRQEQRQFDKSQKEIDDWNRDIDRELERIDP